jgi:hypothetical protein
MTAARNHRWESLTLFSELELEQTTAHGHGHTATTTSSNSIVETRARNSKLAKEQRCGV